MRSSDRGEPPTEGSTARRVRGRPRRDIDRALVADVVAQLFEGGGYAAVSIESTARLLDVSRATLYRTFPSKDQLIKTVLEQATAELCRSATAILEKSGLTPRERLEQLVRMQVEFSFRRPRCGLALSGGADLPSEMVERLQVWRCRYEKLWLRAVRAAIKTGSLPEDDPRVIAWLIAGMTASVSSHLPPSGRFTAEQVADAAIRMIVTEPRR